MKISVYDLNSKNSIILRKNSVVFNKYGSFSKYCMSNMKCVSCGIGFFSPTGADKCSRCAGKESHGSEGHDSCGCGHSH